MLNAQVRCSKQRYPRVGDPMGVLLSLVLWPLRLLIVLVAQRRWTSISPLTWVVSGLIAVPGVVILITWDWRAGLALCFIGLTILLLEVWVMSDRPPPQPEIKDRTGRNKRRQRIHH